MALSPTSSRGVVTNAIQSGGLLGNLNEGLFAPTTTAGFGANQLHMLRFVVPQTGTLHDLSVFVTTSSGNISLAVYDSGQVKAPVTYSVIVVHP